MLILSNGVKTPSAFAQNLPRNASASLMSARRARNVWSKEGITASMTEKELSLFDHPSIDDDRMKQIVGQMIPAMVSYLPQLDTQLKGASALLKNSTGYESIMTRNGAMSESFLMGVSVMRWLIANRRSQHLYSDYGVISLMVREVGTFRFGPYEPSRSEDGSLGLIGIPGAKKDGAVGVVPTRYGVDLTFPRFTVVDGKKVPNHAYTTGFGGRQPIWWLSANQKNMFNTLIGSVRAAEFGAGGKVTLGELNDLYYVLSATPWWFQVLMIACETHARMKNVDAAAVAGTKKMVANPTVGQLWYGYYQLENQSLRSKLVSSEFMKKELNKIDNTFAYLGIPQTFTEMMTKGPSGASVLHRPVLFDIPWLDDLQWARLVGGVSNSELQAWHIEETNRRDHNTIGTTSSVKSLLSSPPTVSPSGVLGAVDSPMSGNLRSIANLDSTVPNDIVDTRLRTPVSRQIILY